MPRALQREAPVPGQLARRPVPPPVDVRGDPYEQGLVQGRALREQLRGCPDILARLEAFRRAAPRWLPFRWFRALARRKAAAAFRGGVRAAVPEMAARIDGIAAGAGVPRALVQLLNLLEPMLSDLRASTRPGGAAAGLGGCTALALRGSRTADGAPLIAHNFDYLPLVQPLYCLRRVHGSGGQRSLEFTLAPLAGAVDGVNGHGLAVALDYAYAVDPAPVAGTATMAVASALASCASVADALALLQELPVQGGGLVMLADAGGDIASLEITNTARHVRRPPPGQDWLVHGNRFCGPATTAVELPGDAVYGRRAPAALQGESVHRSSDRRTARLSELVARDGRFDRAGVGALLADHGPDGVPSGDTVCMHGGYWATTASLHVLPRERALRVAYASACTAEHVEFAL